VNNNNLITYRELSAGCSENQQSDAICGKNEEFLNVKRHTTVYKMTAVFESVNIITDRFVSKPHFVWAFITPTGVVFPVHQI
jgi:hypothetical protein